MHKETKDIFVFMSREKRDLTSGNIAKTLTRLTIPMFFGMVGMVIFNIVDTIYIGRYGSNSLAALSFTYPVIMLIHSITMGLGISISATISPSIGAKNHKKAASLATNGILLSLIIAILAAITGTVSIEPTFRLLGAPQELLPLIKSYMTIWFAGSVAVVIPMTGNSAIRATGDMKTPAVIMLIGAFTNVLVDPILIFGFGPIPSLGLKGAAIATIVSRTITLFASLYVLIFREKLIKLSVVSKENTLKAWKELAFIAIPVSATNLIMPIGIGLSTKIVSTFGKEAVAGFGIGSKLDFFSLAIIMALATALNPFAGQNIGAGKIKRVDESFRKASLFSLTWGVFMYSFLNLLSTILVPMFTNDVQIMHFTILYIRIVALTYPLRGIVMISGTLLNVLKKPIHSAAGTFTQMFLLFLPLALISAKLFGVIGVYISIVISFLMVSIPFFKLTEHFLLKADSL